MDPFVMALLLYLAAVALATVDLFVPSGGLLVILAAVAGIAAVLFGFRSGPTAGMGMLTLLVASIPTFVFLAIKIWPHTPIGKRIILKAPPAAPVPQTASEPNLHDLLGHVVRAESPFLPTGQVRIGHRRLNAVAESGYIEVGTHVKVIAVRERNLIVRPTDEPLSQTAATGQASSATAEAAQPEGNLLDRPAEELGLDSLED